MARPPRWRAKPPSQVWRFFFLRRRITAAALSPDQEDAEEPAFRHLAHEAEDMLLAGAVGLPDQHDGVHAGRRAGVLAEEVEAGQVDQHVLEEIGPVEEEAGERR